MGQIVIALLNIHSTLNIWFIIQNFVVQVDTDADTDNLDSEDQDDDEGNCWHSFMYSGCSFTKVFTCIGNSFNHHRKTYF